MVGYMKEGSSMAQTIQKRGDYIFRNSDRKVIEVIPIWPVMESVYEGKREDNPFRQENGFVDRIVIMYSGNHSVMHSLMTLLEAAVRLKDDKRFLFVHIGSGVRLQEVHDYKEKYGLDNVTISFLTSHVNGFGCPVITYNASSISEIIGNTSLMLKDLSIESLLKALNILTDPLKRSLIIQEGIQNFKRFS